MYEYSTSSGKRSLARSSRSRTSRYATSISAPCLKFRYTEAELEEHDAVIESIPLTVLNSSSSGIAIFSIVSIGTADFQWTRIDIESPSKPFGKSSSWRRLIAIKPTAKIVRKRTNMLTRRLRDNRVIFVASSLDSIREPIGQAVKQNEANAGSGQCRIPQGHTLAKCCRLLRRAWLGRAA